MRTSLFLGPVLAAALGGCRNYTETLPGKDAEDPLSGRADCNRYSGGYGRAGRGRIKVLVVAATRAACPPESISDEFLRIVGAAAQYEIRDTRLWLSGDYGSVLIFGR